MAEACVEQHHLFSSISENLQIISASKASQVESELVKWFYIIWLKQLNHIKANSSAYLAEKYLKEVVLVTGISVV